MEIVEYRSELSTVRSDISNASSGYAFVAIPLPKSRLPIPGYEPPPDYSPENTIKLDSTEEQEVRQSLLHNQSTLSAQSAAEVYSSANDKREPPRLCIQAQNISVEVYQSPTSNNSSLSPSSNRELLLHTNQVYQSPTSNNSSLSPSSNRELLLHTNQVKKTETSTCACSCSKKCLCVLVAILITALVVIVSGIVLFHTVCIVGHSPGCSAK